MKKLVKELMIPKSVKVQEEDPIREVVVKIAEDRETMVACVVDEAGRLKGLITPKELLKEVEVREFGVARYRFFEGAQLLHLLTSRYAKDIMSPPISVKPDDSVDKAIATMLDNRFYEVPVVDGEGKVIGEINYFGIVVGSLEALNR